MHLDNRAHQLKMENMFDIVLQQLILVGAKVEYLHEQVNAVWTISQIQKVTLSLVFLGLSYFF